MHTAWKAAVLADDLGALARLLDEGVDIDAKDDHGQTALMSTARDGRTEVVRFLIGRGADLNHTAKYHLTALMLAVVNARVPIVRALVDAGADLATRGTGAPGFDNKTALDLAAARADYAASHQLGEIVRILEAAARGLSPS
jgi:ankyrin repeat protein